MRHVRSGQKVSRNRFLRFEARRCYNAREKAKFLKIMWLKLTKKRHHNAWCGLGVRFRTFPNFKFASMASMRPSESRRAS